jgi:hypothetical protein
MTHEPLSPELALVDPDLAARARAALPQHVAPAARRSLPPTPAPAPPPKATSVQPRNGSHPYPLWARATAALWLVVLGILIGGAAIPHAQDLPRVVPPSEEVPATCTPQDTNTGPGVAPTEPGR